MIKIYLIAVGKLKEKYFSQACSEYLKRLSAYAKVSVIETPEERCPENPSSAQIKYVIEKEGERILAKLPKNSLIIPLCIEGEQFSSTEFADKIQASSITGYSEFTFIIGGSYGLSDAVKQKGNLKLSFGKITLPHQLMRVVLLEQIYRAFSIINNSRYHK